MKVHTLLPVIPRLKTQQQVVLLVDAVIEVPKVNMVPPPPPSKKCGVRVILDGLKLKITQLETRLEDQLELRWNYNKETILLQTDNADLKNRLLREAQNSAIAATKLLQEHDDHNTTRLPLVIERESKETNHHE
jgi:hypothetical protein